MPGRLIRDLRPCPGLDAAADHNATSLLCLGPLTRGSRETSASQIGATSVKLAPEEPIDSSQRSPIGRFVPVCPERGGGRCNPHVSHVIAFLKRVLFLSGSWVMKAGKGHSQMRLPPALCLNDMAGAYADSTVREITGPRLVNWVERKLWSAFKQCGLFLVSMLMGNGLHLPSPRISPGMVCMTMSAGWLYDILQWYLERRVGDVEHDTMWKAMSAVLHVSSQDCNRRIRPQAPHQVEQMITCFRTFLQFCFCNLRALS